jgi:hypothetical protein
MRTAQPRETLMVEVKGAGIRSGLAWIAQQYGEPAREQLIAQLPVELRDLARAPLAASWYPVALVDHIFVAVPRIAGRTDRAGIESIMKQLNAWIAEDNLTTLYKFLLAFLTPERLTDRMPALFKTYYRGIDATVRRESPLHAVCTVEGLGKCAPYLAPSAAGWLEFAYRKVGARVRVTEESWQRGLDRADPLVFHVEWS